MPSKELRRKIGQLFLMGFEGRNITPHVRNLISRYHVGGLILFSRNISEPVQAWELIRSFKSPGLLRCIDHEGGRVVRLPEPVTAFPPAARLGDHGSPALARSAALYQARELAALGINLNFAPVLDVHTNTVNRVIADRAFSTHPEIVAQLGAEYVQGCHEAGVASCGKHFPGHGDTREDSHEVLPRVRRDRAGLRQRELVPFRAAIRSGLSAVMTAHVVYDDVDRNLPATLSPTIIGELLRRELGFDGVVMTDDLEMRGISAHWDVEDRTILALKAGADMLMFCHSPDTQLAALETAYRAVDGRIIKVEQIERSYERVQKLKALCRKATAAGNRGDLLGILNRAEHKALAASLK